MQPNDLIALAGVISTAAVALLSIVVSQRRHREEVQRMERLLEIEHAHIPHLEFHLGCNFYGPQEGEYVAEFLMGINNKGRVQHTLKSLKLRVRGVKASDKLEFWEKYPGRLHFPDKILETQVIHKKYGFFFIEPNVEQTISFVSKIPEQYRFIVVWAEFGYGLSRGKAKGKRHSAERVFEVKPKSA